MIEIIDESTFLRPIYAGNIIIKVKLVEPLKIMTIRPTMFPVPSFQNSNENAQIQEIDLPIPEFPSTKWIDQKLSNSSLPDLANAQIVISGGIFQISSFFIPY